MRKGLVVGTVAAVVLGAAGSAFGYLRAREPAPPAFLPGFEPNPLPADQAARAGVGLAVPASVPSIARAGARWYFNWSVHPHRGVRLEFVPLVCGYPGAGVSDKQLQSVRETIQSNPADYPNRTLFLVGNEIGYKPQQDRRPPAAYARDFRRC